MARPIVDVHTHIYPPSYMALLQSRTTVPLVRSFPTSPQSPSSDSPANMRLIILPSEASSPSTASGRPIGPEYYSIQHKLAFMETHTIDISILSLANPWLDFLPPETAAATAIAINNEINSLCSQSDGKLYAFAALPLSASVPEIVAEVRRIKDLKYMRGVIMGTSGLGKGLDDPQLDPIYEALDKLDVTIFLHPHYGLPADVYGPRAAAEYGHVLPLALGFPIETTIAVARMFLSGVWDRFSNLQVLLAHSGGTLPFLAGRIESCILHDGHLMGGGKAKKRRTLWEVLKANILLDAVVYSGPGLKAAVEVSGSDRVLFGKRLSHLIFMPADVGLFTLCQVLSRAVHGCT